MKNRLKMVMELLEDVQHSLDNYEKAKKGKGYAWVGNNLNTEDSKTSIARRILVAREELLKISKSL